MDMKSFAAGRKETTGQAAPCRDFQPCAVGRNDLENRLADDLNPIRSDNSKGRTGYSCVATAHHDLCLSCFYRLQRPEIPEAVPHRNRSMKSYPPSLRALALVILVGVSVPMAAAGEDSDNGSDTKGPEQPKHKQLLQDAEAYAGLIPLYLKDNKLFAELGREHYKNEFIVLLSIARGIGRNPILGGMTWGDGDDWIWSFRKINKRVLIVRKNVRFRADKNTPAATAVKHAYTDSVLFSLPIVAKGPHGGDLVELTNVFMSDLPQISQVLNGFFFSAEKSTWIKPRAFKDNVEIEVAATYSSNGKRRFESVPDSRGVTINVHYSISKVRGSNYRPRLADDRVGYFLSVVKDYSKHDKRDRFVRYINRWNLQKADPSAALSPPKQPIIFWLENTVPFKYRKTIREGIEEWNKAFEQAGFANAVEVRQQPDDADWDPEDVNYNTFRWITSSAGFAMGPSRVNPYTGEILDADILFDADFLQVWRNEFEHLTPESIAAMTGGALDIETYRRQQRSAEQMGGPHPRSCDRQRSMARQLLFGTISFAQSPATAQYKAEREKMIMQGLKGTVMHEVGHTLGLRHNFKGSTHLTLQQLNDPAITAEQGMLSSVMDYDAVNIVGDLARQGDYFTPTIGPYDIWAIKYGYKPFRSDESGELAKIASRSGEPQLAYATDEDTRGIDPDPFTNRWDLGHDPLEFAIQRAELIEELLPRVVERMSEDGEDYSQTRQAFNALLSDYGQAMYFVSRFVGGVEVSRSHKGDPEAGEPLRVINAERQREALEVLQNRIFSDRPFQLPAQIYNQPGSNPLASLGAANDFAARLPGARRDSDVAIKNSRPVALQPHVEPSSRCGTQGPC